MAQGWQEDGVPPELGSVPVRGQNTQGYGKFLEAGVTRLYKPGVALAQGGSYTRDMHTYGKEMSLTNQVQVFPYCMS